MSDIDNSFSYTFSGSRYSIVPDSGEYLYITGSGKTLQCTNGFTQYTNGTLSGHYTGTILSSGSLISSIISDMSGSVPVYSDYSKTGYFYQPTTTTSQTVNVDTKREINEIQTVNVDTERDVTNSNAQTINIDTNRKIGITQSITTDTKRKLVSYPTFPSGITNYIAFQVGSALHLYVFNGNVPEKLTFNGSGYVFPSAYTYDHYLYYTATSQWGLYSTNTDTGNVGQYADYFYGTIPVYDNNNNNLIFDPSSIPLKQTINVDTKRLVEITQTIDVDTEREVENPNSINLTIDTRRDIATIVPAIVDGVYFLHIAHAATSGDYYIYAPASNSGYFYINESGNVVVSETYRIYHYENSSWVFKGLFDANTLSESTTGTWGGTLPIYSDLTKINGYFYKPITPTPFEENVNIDIKRRLIDASSTISINIDTKRRIGESESFLVDTERIIETILSQIIHADTKRSLLKSITFNLDTRREVLISETVIADTERDIVKLYEALVNVDTERKVNKTVIALVDTERKLNSIVIFNLDTDRKTLPYEFFNKAVKKYNLKMDLINKVENDIIRITQNDFKSVIFNITITSNGETVDLTGDTVKIVIDNKDNINLCIVNDITNGIVEYYLTQKDTASIDIHEFAIELVTDDSRITTKRWKYRILEDLNK